MANRKREVHQSAIPLFNALEVDALTRGDVVEKLGLGSRKIVSNWLAFGIPGKYISKVAGLCSMTTDAYLVAAGLPPDSVPRMIQPASPKTEQLVANFESLPPAPAAQDAERMAAGFGEAIRLTRKAVS